MEGEDERSAVYTSITPRITGTHPLLDRSGQPFRPLTTSTTPPTIPPDPEGIAFDPGRQRLYWSSEGERLTAGPLLLDPHRIGKRLLPPMDDRFSLSFNLISIYIRPYAEYSLICPGNV